MIFCNRFCLILLLQIFVYIFSIYLCIFVCTNIFGAVVLKPRFKIDAVIMIICSIVIIINSVLTLQVRPLVCGPCEIKVVFIHTWFASYLYRVRVLLSGLINGRNQHHSWGFPQASHSGPSLCQTGGTIKKLFDVEENQFTSSFSISVQNASVERGRIE
jgi:hypothetical protein